MRQTGRLKNRPDGSGNFEAIQIFRWQFVPDFQGQLLWAILLRDYFHCRTIRLLEKPSAYPSPEDYI